MFYDIFISLCKSKNIKPTPLVLEMGLSSSNVSQWKKGSTPRPEVLQRIAEYFGVSVSYLLTGEEQKESPPQSGEPPKYDQLTPENRAMIDDLIEKLLKSQSGG